MNPQIEKHPNSDTEVKQKRVYKKPGVQIFGTLAQITKISNNQRNTRRIDNYYGVQSYRT